MLSSLEETRALARMYYDRILKPCMLHLDKQSLYMAKTAATIKPGLDYHVIVYAGYRMAGFELSRLWNSFSWTQKVLYYMMMTVVPYIYPLPGIRSIFNLLARIVVYFQRPV